MPLDVTTGSATAAVGGGPPGLASPSDSGPPGSPAVLFSALMAQQGQAAPATPPKTATILVTGAAKPDVPKHDKADEADAPQSSAQGQTDLTAINWAAMAALQTPALVLAPKTPPTEQMTVSRAPATTKEVMDTASLSAPGAPAAKSEPPSSGLLPLPAAPQPQPTATGAARVVTDAARNLSDSVTASPAGDGVTETDARTVPSALSAAAPVAVPINAASPSQSAAPTLQAAAPSSAWTALPVQALPPLPVSPQAVPPLSMVPAAKGTSPSPPPAAIPSLVATLMPGLKPMPAVAGTESKKPFLSSPARPPSLPFGVTVLKETPAQIALQSSAAPANNTGDTAASSGIRSVTPTGTALAAEAARDVMPKTLPAAETTPVDTAKAAPGAGHDVNMEQTPPQAVVTTAADTPASSDRSLKVGKDTTDGDLDSAVSLTAAVAPPGQNPVEPGTPTPVAEKPLTGAERAQVVRQTADAISTVKPQAAATGQGQMTLHLHPKEWGDLRVTVQLAPTPAIDGVKQTAVVAHVVASSPVVKTALEKHSSDLNQALRETGLRLERLTVTVQAASAGEESGAASGGRNFAPKSQDQWQGTPSQTSAGSGGLGAGGSSSFASFSERQGGGAFHNQPASRSAYTSGDEDSTDIAPVSRQAPGLNAGFDQRV